jgi:thiamine biosynthesis lipoprotein
MKTFRRAKPLLGTFVEISIEAEHVELAHKSMTSAFHVIEECQSILSVHDDSSELSILNKTALSVEVHPHPMIATLLQLSAQLNTISQGAFDIVCPLHVGDMPTFSDVRLSKGGNVKFLRPLFLDLGGIAKGFAVDLAVESLQVAGCAKGVVNAGGDLRVFGPGMQEVYVRSPSDPLSVLGPYQVSECALATSANYYRRSGQGCCKDSGIRNPLSNQSWQEDSSVTVIANTAVIADALTKVVAFNPSCLGEVLNYFGAEVVQLKNSSVCARSEAAFATL